MSLYSSSFPGHVPCLPHLTEFSLAPTARIKA